MTNATLMIKTVARPECLRKLLKSVRIYYPALPILIADDSKQPYPEIAVAYGAEVHVLPFDTGAPASYNHLMQFVKTPYTILGDDDFVFTKETQLEKWIPYLEVGLCDLVGGPVIAAHRNGKPASFVGNFEVDDGVLKLRRTLRDQIAFLRSPVRADVVMNWFCIRTEVLQGCPWDGDQKVFRHLDWFLAAKKAGIRVMYSPNVPVLHDHGRGEAYYGELRHGRMKDYIRRFCEKHGFRDVDEDA